MGIHGLATFLRENKRTLSKPLAFSDNAQNRDIPLVVDGWSFIYKLLQDSNLPWVYGGEYVELTRLVTDTVKAWIKVGLRPIFVFDGPTPVEKFQTVVSRLNQACVQPGLLFFRTSAASRNSRRFQKETQIIPPLSYAVCVRALLDFRTDGLVGNGTIEDDELVDHGKLEVHFADEEGDPYAVELAGRVEGYVTGRDSDFVVLNSDGYKGYIPLDELLWLGDGDDDDPLEDGIANGFQYVKSKKRRVANQSMGQGIIPPASGNLTLSASLYTPAALAHVLNLPLSLLPLLGALVGNDYTMQGTLLTTNSITTSSKSFHNLLFERRLNLSQRILHVGSVLASFVRPPPGKRKTKAPRTVMELIEMTINALTSSSNAPASLTGPDQIQAIVENIVEGTLPYAMPMRPSEETLLRRMICALHYPEECRLLAILNRSEHELPAYSADVASAYLRAYRLGRFSPSLMNILSSRTFWPKIFLENPDTEAVSRSISRSIREFVYAVLEDGIGIPSYETECRDEDEQDAEQDETGEEDPDELIDVVEEYSDECDSEEDVSADLGKLRGALRDLRYDKTPNNERVDDLSETISEVESNATSISAPQSSVRIPSPLAQRPIQKKPFGNRQKTVIEYVRKGTRVITEDVSVSTLRKLLPSHYQGSPEQGNAPRRYVPLQLRPEGERLRVLLDTFAMDPVALEKVSRDYVLPLLSLRHVVRHMHERALEAQNSKERQLERWTRNEARSFLVTISADASALGFQNIEPPSEISERSIQLTAQILTTLESVEQFTQALLLTESVPECAPRFSGSRFHALLTSPDLPTYPIDDGLWHAATAGLDECFAEERTSKKAKKKAQRNGNASAPVAAQGKIQKTNSGGMYSLLTDVSA